MAKHKKGDGFTLVELLVGALVTSLTVAAGLKLSRMSTTTSKEQNSAVIELQTCSDKSSKK